LYAVDGVGLRRRLVGAITTDARKPQRHPAQLSGTALHGDQRRESDSQGLAGQRQRRRLAQVAEQHRRAADIGGWDVGCLRDRVGDFSERCGVAATRRETSTTAE